MYQFSEMIDGHQYLWVRQLLQYAELERRKQEVTVHTDKPIDDSWADKVVLSKATRAFAHLKGKAVADVMKQDSIVDFRSFHIIKVG